MKIYCCSCAKYVGEVRDGKLMKGLGFICPDCRDALVGEEEILSKHKDDPMVDYLKNMFGMNK